MSFSRLVFLYVGRYFCRSFFMQFCVFKVSCLCICLFRSFVVYSFLQLFLQFVMSLVFVFNICLCSYLFLGISFFRLFQRSVFPYVVRYVSMSGLFRYLVMCFLRSLCSYAQMYVFSSFLYSCMYFVRYLFVSLGSLVLSFVSLVCFVLNIDCIHACFLQLVGSVCIQLFRYFFSYVRSSVHSLCMYVGLVIYVLFYLFMSFSRQWFLSFPLFIYFVLSFFHQFVRSRCLYFFSLFIQFVISFFRYVCSCFVRSLFMYLVRLFVCLVMFVLVSLVLYICIYFSLAFCLFIYLFMYLFRAFVICLFRSFLLYVFSFRSFFRYFFLSFIHQVFRSLVLSLFVCFFSSCFF